MELRFTINEQIIQRLDNNRLATGSRNKIQANFTFNESWNGMEKFAIFKDEYNNPYRAYLGIDGCTFNCTIPCEALRGRFFSVSVYAGDTLTSNELVIPLEKGGYPLEPHHHKHKHHHPSGCSKDVFVDIYERIHSCFDTVEFVEDELRFYKNNHLDTTVSLPYSHEDEVNAWMAEADLKFQDIQDVLATKSDIGHKHVTEDVTDYGDNMDSNLNSLLCAITESINNL